MTSVTQHASLLSRPSLAFWAHAMTIGMLGVALAPSPVGAQSSDSLGGQWIGTMDVTSEFGELKHYTEVVVLDQSGRAVTGSFALGAALPTPLLHALVHGTAVTFAIAIERRQQMDFHLRLESGQLVGYASCITDLGRVRAKVKLMRVPDPAAGVDLRSTQSAIA
jgi:hypothetical protein